MSTTDTVLEQVRQAFERPTGGFVRVVDRLIRLCPESGLHFDHKQRLCRISLVGNGDGEKVEVTLRGFRAMLARFAVLCDEYRPGTFSSYGGDAEFVSPERPGEVFRAVFVNTTAQQCLTLTRSGDDNA